MPSGVPKRILRTIKRRVKERPKGRENREREIKGCIYLPEETIGHEVIIQVLEK